MGRWSLAGKAGAVLTDFGYGIASAVLRDLAAG
jgi:hypothetical protein